MSYNKNAFKAKGTALVLQRQDVRTGRDYNLIQTGALLVAHSVAFGVMITPQTLKIVDASAEQRVE